MDNMLGDHVTFDGEIEPIASVQVRVKGELPLWRPTKEGEPLTIVLTGRVGMPKMVRKNGIVYEVHDLVAEVIAEAGHQLAGDVSNYLVEVATRDRAEQDTGNRDQQSIDDAIKDDEGDEF